MAFTLIPAEGSDFINRKELLEDMVETLSHPNIRMGFALYGIRRVGKTSIFKEVARRLAAQKAVVPVYFSVWKLVENTVEEFARKLSFAILDAYGDRVGFTYKAKNLVETSLSLLKDILRNLSLSLKLREEIEIVLASQYQGKSDAGAIIEQVFSFAEHIAQETNTRGILFLDEFPSVMELKNNNARVGEGIIRFIRTLHETQQHTIICISGSIRKTMEITVLSSASAFYKQLIIRKIDPLERKYIKELLSRNLPSISEEVVEKIWTFSRGIPFYAQAVGRQLERMEKVDISAVEQAITSFLTQEGAIILREQFSQLGPKERKIVEIMAKEDLCSISEISARTRESFTTTSRFLLYLEEKGVLEKVDKAKFQFQDSVFKQWLQQQD